MPRCYEAKDLQGTDRVAKNKPRVSLWDTDSNEQNWQMLTELLAVSVPLVLITVVLTCVCKQLYCGCKILAKPYLLHAYAGHRDDKRSPGIQAHTLDKRHRGEDGCRRLGICNHCCAHWAHVLDDKITWAD